MRKARFSLERRERFLALLSVGQTVEGAAAAAGTSRQTVGRWVARGRVPGGSPEYRAFSERFDAIRSGEAEDVARRREAEQEEEEEPGLDPFTFLSPAEMSELTEPQRQRAREVFIDAQDARPPPWLTAEEWQIRRGLILRGEWDVLPAEPVEERFRQAQAERETEAGDPWPAEESS